jgi:hypothetical protein
MSRAFYVATCGADVALVTATAKSILGVNGRIDVRIKDAQGKTVWPKSG